MRSNVKKIFTTFICIIIGIILPIFMCIIPNAMSVFIPMHIPILVCGIAFGWKYGIAAGIVTPILSSLLTGIIPSEYLPVIIVELTVYGLVSGIIIKNIDCKSRIGNIYLALIISMLSGRIAMGIGNAIIFSSINYGFYMWIQNAFISEYPGIVIQLLLIPAIIISLEKIKIISKDK